VLEAEDYANGVEVRALSVGDDAIGKCDSNKLAEVMPV
jgi:hypothetical protein